LSHSFTVHIEIDHYNDPEGDKERERLLAFVAKAPEADRWLDLAHALLMTNEFVFVD
jgi:hypothetical protein